MNHHKNQLTTRDEQFITRVLSLAEQSRKDGYHPFAALVVDANGTLIAEAMNASSSDRTTHAEMNALRLAAGADLQGATPYSSVSRVRCVPVARTGLV